MTTITNLVNQAFHNSYRGSRKVLEILTGRTMSSSEDSKEWYLEAFNE